MLEDLPEEVLLARPGGRLMEPRPVPEALARRAARADEVEDLVALLLDHAEGPREAAAAIAETLAVACLGDNHLWQDLQLGSRAELSALMTWWFPALVRKNSADMKWKKFLYKQLCEREQLFVCKAPSCAVCCDHALCFGPEDGARRAVAA
ncbi:nitrogen fixation protein NifQ [Rubrivivax sp. JA1055]|uniref:nitrogen fixation protein NifQ n=1 Tax=Rubrivivax sp. JA1029 TaxID=2894193 RepID=UPI001E303F7B|nr:nitrogen fixation protein NifQ [Rubrivivax sp. JA1029]MCC9595647.1 nitrogen fixation protein NifQ [Rubrivivax sp. JA1055]MCC9646846.1 nitrogen fixation protein NifQ [Rubrivivax sp. JA1029]